MDMKKDAEQDRHSASGLVDYLRRVGRMFTLLAAGRISFKHYWLALRRRQVAVPLIGGGMVFCDRSAERVFFGED